MIFIKEILLNLFSKNFSKIDQIEGYFQTLD